MSIRVNGFNFPLQINSSINSVILWSMADSLEVPVELLDVVLLVEDCGHVGGVPGTRHLAGHQSLLARPVPNPWTLTNLEQEVTSNSHGN